MKVYSFEVEGLFGKSGKIECNFHKDINILTGRNGAGKTSIMKLLWYIMSGNILLGLQEVVFKAAIVRTDRYICTVQKLSHNTCRIFLEIDGEVSVFEDSHDEEDGFSQNAEDQANPILMGLGSSVFLPTFRRIEGGFTINPRRGALSALRPSLPRSDIEEGLVTLSRRLTHNQHTFVAAISTTDIVAILLKKYADLSEIYNDLQKITSQQIIQTIKDFKSDIEESGNINSARIVIDNIRSNIEFMESERDKIMLPIESVRTLVERIFRHTGIAISARLNFGDAANSISSDSLSAGEKQMLSFICYNSLFSDCIFVIDEPELSLHVDWQRQLFSVLQSQNSSNQFIVATHSPFIYSKYPDKEITIDPDRGYSENGKFEAT
jgi:predicted ATPase